jgi:hypothetical protein
MVQLAALAAALHGSAVDYQQWLLPCSDVGGSVVCLVLCLCLCMFVSGAGVLRVYTTRWSARDSQNCSGTSTSMAG